MADVEFKPMDPLDLYDLYREELSTSGHQSLGTEFGFSPPLLKRFLNEVSPRHHSDIDNFKERVDKVGLFVANLRHLRSNPTEGISPALREEDLDLYHEFHTRLGSYTVALEELEDDKYHRLKTVAGNVACSVSYSAWRDFRKSFNVPERSITDCSAVVRHLEAQVNYSIY